MRYSRTFITTFALIIASFFLVTMDIQVQAEVAEDNRRGLVQIETTEDWAYVVQDDGTIMLYLYSGSDTDVVVPAQIDGKSVTAIGYQAFYQSSNLTSITIPASITKVEAGGFDGCGDIFLYIQAGSYLETYAKEQGLLWLCQGNISCTHSFSSKITKAPGCVEGLGEKRFTCDKCGGYYKEDILPSGSHTQVIDAEVAATCTTPGKTEGMHCSVCNEVLITQDEIPLLEHEYTTVIKKATPKKNGSVTEKCMHCGKVNKKASRTIYRPKKIKMAASIVVNSGETKFTVVDSKNKKISDSNYSASFKNNKKVGVETLTVTFSGKYYTGKMKKTFTVKPRGTSISSVTTVNCPKSDRIQVYWSGLLKGDVTGYQVQYSTKKNFKGAKSVTVKKVKTSKKEIKGLKADTKYYVRVRTYKNVKVNGKTKKIYSDWSKKVAVTTPEIPTLNTRPVESKWIGGYELFVLHLDERGYPYYYAISLGGGAEDYAKSDICQDEIFRYMEAIGVHNFGTAGDKVGVYNGIYIMKVGVNIF